MAWLTFFRPCTKVKVRVTLDASVQSRIFRLRTQPGPLHELVTIFLFSSPYVIELSTLTCTSTTTMFECLDRRKKGCDHRPRTVLNTSDRVVEL